MTKHTFGSTSSRRRRPSLLVWLLMTMFASMPVGSKAADWPQWRGPYGNGIGDGVDLPVQWGPNENIAWKIELPSWSGSSPIVWQDYVWVISPGPQQEPDTDAAEPQERRRRRGRFGTNVGGPGGPDIRLLCLRRQDGTLRWQRELDKGNQLRLKHNSSSPSPVTDGVHVWATTGNGVVVALDLNGREIWRVDLQERYGRFGMQFGYASSPLLYQGKLIFQVLHGQRTDDPSYLVALDSATGRQLWHSERATDARRESPDAYTTPTVLSHAGTDQIVILGADYVTGHDPDTGAERWRSGGLNPQKAGNYRIVPSPLAVDGMIYAPTRKMPLLALRAGGSGDITSTHLAWRWQESGAPDVPTPVCDGRFFYMADDQGRVTCLNAKTGTVIWGPHDTGIGSVSASAVLADGKLYIVSESGETAVVQAGPEYKLVARNQLDGGFTLSSPAVAGNRLFIRTAGHLYCIGKVQR